MPNALLRPKARARKKFLREVVFHPENYRHIEFLDGYAQGFVLSVPEWVERRLGQIEDIDGIQHGERFGAMHYELLSSEEMFCQYGEEGKPQIFRYSLEFDDVECDCFLVTTDRKFEGHVPLLATLKVSK